MNKKKLIFFICLAVMSIGALSISIFSKGQPGIQGETGKDGISVVSILYTSSVDNVDTYTITYSDGTTSFFTVTNGVNGANGIQGIPGVDGHSPVITIGDNGNWYIDGVDTKVVATGPQGPIGPQGPQGDPGKDGRGIVSIVLANSQDNVDTYVILYSDNTSTVFTVTNGKDGTQGIQGIPGVDGHSPVITIGDNGNWYIDGVDTKVVATGPQGPQGNPGQDGRGILSITLASSNNNVDTYIILYSDNTSSSFTVTNGKDGAQGIQGIQGKPGADGHTPVITIVGGYWYIDGVTTNVKAEGLKGETGNGISSILLTKTEGLVDTYTITFTNGETTTFTVTNGKDGTQGIQGIQGIPGKDGHTPVITIKDGYWYIDGVDTKVVAIGPQGPIGPQGENGLSAYEIYIKYHPEYKGTEEEWIEDLVNGRLMEEDKYTISFIVEDNIYLTKSVSTGDKVSKPEDPTRDGYSFVDWVDEDGEHWVFNGYSITEDINLYARWTANTYQITLDLNGGIIQGSEPVEFSICYGESLDLNNYLVFKEGYDFSGWYYNDKLISQGVYNYLENITLVAHWEIKTSIIIFDSNGGSFIENQEILYNGKISKPRNPTRIGYEFIGWYYNNQEWNFNNVVKEDVTLIAQWNPYFKYNVLNSE